DAIGDTLSVTVNAGGAFDFRQTTETYKKLTLSGSGINGTGAWVNNAATSGTLTVPSGVILASDVTIGGSGNLATSSTISGAFMLTKVGLGTLTLFGNNSYSGGTTLN